MPSNRQSKRHWDRTYSAEGREVLRASDAVAAASSTNLTNKIVPNSQIGSTIAVSLQNGDLQPLIPFIKPLPARLAKVIADNNHTRPLVSIRREINAKETAVTKFGTTEDDGKPYIPVSLRNLPKARPPESKASDLILRR